MQLIGEIFVNEFGLGRSVLEDALKIQEEKGGKIGEILLGKQLIAKEDFLKALSSQLDLPYIVDISDKEIDLDLIRNLPIHYAKRNFVLPIALEDDGVVIASADPLNLNALDDLRLFFKTEPKVTIALPDVVITAINRVYDRASESAERMMDDLEEENLSVLAQELEEPQDLLDAADEAPIIKLVNSLLFQAVKERATDIHVEPMEREVIVRFRIDGILYEIIKPPKRFQNSIASRIKVMAGLNIAEKRLPQDGRIRIKLAGKDIDIRVSVVPTSYGERIVMRLLDKTNVMLDLEDIGLAGYKLEQVQKLIRLSHGIVLVTGPTGSGKTTTLYAGLTRINTTDRNIITVEDPVEYQIKGIGQIQVNPKIGLTFANGLRSILRQDPDVIMVGEIRDRETADIAIQAAQTGHLVFSTLHTNDSSGAITRLIDMGVEPFLISSSLVGVIAQRLIRKLCKSCRIKYSPTEAELREIGIEPQEANGDFYRPIGCDSCLKTGYTGRTGIYELLIVSDEICDLIVNRAPSNVIKKAATAAGMLTLRDDGAKKVLDGITSIQEVLNATQEELAG